MTSPTEHRRAFDAAMNRYKDGDPAGAREAFARITANNPAMADAWLGRLACGDHSLDALAGAHTNSRALYRETRRIGLQDGQLQAIDAHPAVSGDSGVVASHHRVGLRERTDPHRPLRRALEVLNDPVLTDDAQAAMWRQFITASLYHRTQRWPDLSHGDRRLPAGDRHRRAHRGARGDPIAARDGVGCPAGRSSPPWN